MSVCQTQQGRTPKDRVGTESLPLVIWGGIYFLVKEIFLVRKTLKNYLHECLFVIVQFCFTWKRVNLKTKNNRT